MKKCQSGFAFSEKLFTTACTSYIYISRSETVHDRKYIIYITVSAVLGIAHVWCRPFKISVLFNPSCVWVLFQDAGSHRCSECVAFPTY